MTELIEEWERSCAEKAVGGMTLEEFKRGLDDCEEIDEEMSGLKRRLEEA